MSYDYLQPKHQTSDQPAIGLFREGKYLVVELTHHLFPDRCIKTDMPIAGAHTVIELRAHNVEGDELNLVRGLASASTNQMLKINETNKGNNVVVPLALPLIPAQAARLTSLYPMLSVILSILFTIGCYAGAFAFVDKPTVLLCCILGSFIGIVLMIGSFVMMRLRVQRVLWIKRLADRKVWLRGVHPDWLARLPEYRISPELLQRDYRRAASSVWFPFAVAILAAIAALVFVPMAVQGYYHGVASRDWPSIEGQINRVSYAKHRSNQRTWWTVDFDYTIQVEGKSFTGKASERESTVEEAQANAQRKPPGTPVTVFYNPRRPADNRVVRGISNTETTWIVFAIAVSIIAVVAACYGLIARSRANAYKDQIDGLTGPPAFGRS